MIFSGLITSLSLTAAVACRRSYGLRFLRAACHYLIVVDNYGCLSSWVEAEVPPLRLLVPRALRYEMTGRARGGEGKGEDVVIG
ncbi:MAG: hypothetical protein LBH84_03615 [Prevotellaceae bacterium]|jgi:hypothetical protein|nr:hypothetical protein [Prevotellaceae bacterium]